MLKYWREGLIVFALTLLASMALKFIPGPSSIQDLLSPATILLSLLIFMIPFFTGVVGGYMISRKNTKNDLSYILVPALGAAAASLLLMAYSILQMTGMSDIQWASEFERAKSFLPSNTTLEDFRSLSTSGSVLGLVVSGLINFGLGGIGGLAGRTVESFLRKRVGR